MRKLLNEPLTYLFTYFLGIIITFGHAYNNMPKGYYSTWSPSVYIEYGIAEKALAASFAAAGWPFYVSVQLQKEVKNEKQ